MSDRTHTGYGDGQVTSIFVLNLPDDVCQDQAMSQQGSSTKPKKDLLERTEKEISRKIIDIETINCLRTGFRPEDRTRYLSMVELRKRVHRASVSLQSTMVLDQKMEELTKRLEKDIQLEEELLLTVREVQAESVEYFLSRLRG